MKNITILTDFYYPKPLANGICVQKLVREITDRGIEVNIICFKTADVKSEHEIIDGVNVYYIKNRIFYYLREIAEQNSKKLWGKALYKASIMIYRIKKLIYMPIYPISAPLFALRYSKRAEDIIKKSNSDTIISVFNPIESLIAGLIIKRKIKNIQWIIYSLDTLSNDVKNSFLSSEGLNHKGWKWEKRFFTYADMLLNMKCHQSHYSQNRYKQFENKMHITDIPLFIEKHIQKEITTPLKKEKLNFMYTGALDLGFRNPQYFCELFKIISETKPIQMMFFSRGNCESMISRYEKSTSGRIKGCGYIDQNDMEIIRDSSDYLISIGNKGSDMIPSKIFEYISTTKPIIHLYISQNDSCLPYLMKYPNSLLINENDDMEYNIEKLQNFISRDHTAVDLNKIKDDFIMNTPKYTVDKLLSLADKGW